MKLASLLLLTLAAPAAHALPAHALPQDLPEAEAVLADHRAALGEPQALAKVANVTFHGTAAWKGLEGTGRITEVYGGFGEARTTTEFEEFGRFEQGTDGKLVWERNPIGISIRTGWDAAEFIRRYGIARHADWKLMYDRARTVGAETLDGRRCWVLNMHPKKIVALDARAEKEVPPPDVWYLDAETFLPVRIDAKALNALGQIALMRIETRDWKAVDGILYPHEVEVDISGFRLTLAYNSIEHDLELAEDFFVLEEDVLTAAAQERDPAPRDDTQPVLTDQQEVHIASIRVTCKRADMQKTLGVILPEVFQGVIASGAPMAGQPLVRYHSFGDELDIEAAIPLREPMEPRGRIKAEKLPAGKVVVAWHVGPYDTLGETHERIQAFMEKEGLEQRESCWEEYWTDPGMEPDPSKWRTRIVMPARALR